MSRGRPWPWVTIGIIGGGQLAKMMVQKGKKMGFTMGVLDPSPGSPAGQIADFEIVGGFDELERLRELAARCDTLTYDLEHIDVEALRRLQGEGSDVQPRPDVLAVVQDKLDQRRFFERAGLPQPRFAECDEPTPAALAEFGFPLVQKLRRGGYDGRGVAILRSPEDPPLRGPSVLEELVPIRKELAVIVARGAEGEIRCYLPVEMEFDPRANILDLLLAPARVPAEVAEQARELASRAAEALETLGVLGVELFWAEDGRMLLNEVAPRPHNSGHYTWEACVTSQFEQHQRGVVGLPLGSPEQMRPAVMLNLLGADASRGPAVVDGFAEALAVDGVSIHIYGKAETRPFRKMGHVTVLDEDLDRAREKAIQVKSLLRVRSR